MKKNFLTRVITMTMAAVMALTPVTASAAEKKVVTRAEVSGYWDKANDDAGLTEDDFPTKEAYKNYYKLMSSLDGCYQENGNKIYTILNGSKKTFKKTGSYSIIVGGKTAKKDEGTFKFVAPKTGTYKFTFTTKDNVAGEQIFIDNRTTGSQIIKFKTDYKLNGKKYSQTSAVAVTNNAKHSAYIPAGSNVLASIQDSWYSTMTKVSGTVKLKKGQYVQYVARSSHAAYDEDEAYNFTGFDVTITKTK